MVLETSWGTRGGWVIVRDLLLMGPWHDEEERSHTHRRAPTDYDADHVLLRMIRCVNGEVQMVLGAALVVLNVVIYGAVVFHARRARAS